MRRTVQGMRQHTLFPPGPTARPVVTPAPSRQDGHLAIDAQGLIVDVDAPAERLLGFGRTQLLGNDVGMLMRAESALALSVIRERHLARRSAAAPARFRSMRARRADGTDTELLVMVRESISARGRGFSVVLREPRAIR